ncbi:MAG: hypothetical protein K2Q23_04290 [Bryobacteraceae bacterium]|nr:hypothetical protein [Bryobacteraceae bacterium]
MANEIATLRVLLNRDGTPEAIFAMIPLVIAKESNEAAIETWAAYGAAADRRWLEPLIETLLSPEPKL